MPAHSPGDPFAAFKDLPLLPIGRGAEALFLSCLNRRYSAEPCKSRRDLIRRRQAQSHKDLPDLCSTVLRRHLRSCFLSVKSRAQVTVKGMLVQISLWTCVNGKAYFVSALTIALIAALSPRDLGL